MTAMATQSRGADNARAKKELGWMPRYPSWRQGFAAAYGPAAPPASPRPASNTRPASPAP
jgi:hypothetical protein